MTQSNLKEVLARLIHDWKSKQKWNSWECGVQLENELAHFPLDDIHAMSSEIDKCRRLLRDVALAYSNDCSLPYDGAKPSTMRAVREYLKTVG